MADNNENENKNVTSQDFIQCHGRTVIYSPYKEVTKDNVVTIIATAMPFILKNKVEVTYLNNYYRGITPIYLKQKTVRPEINNKISVNRASEIVAFKVGYLLNEPVQYISAQSDNEETLNKINELNKFMAMVDKNYYDHDLAEKFSIAGTSYRMILPNTENGTNENESPFNIYDIDTNSAFVIYHSGVGHRPLLGGYILDVIDPMTNVLKTTVCCYSETEYFEVQDIGVNGGLIVKELPHALGIIPIIEYPNNISRIGSFELVLPLLDAINHAYSSEFDGIDQTVQSLLKFINADISAEDFEKLKDLGAIKIKSVQGQDADVEFITQKLDQSTLKQIIDSLYSDILTICGMPNQKGSTESTSDNMGAVLVRNGWSGAESRAKTTELVFKKSEKETLKIALNCMDTFRKIKLNISDIDIKMPRRNYENIGQKATVLTQMLGSDKIHPKLAFEHCGMFTDPEVAYLMSKNYTEQLEKIKLQLNTQTGDNNEN